MKKANTSNPKRVSVKLLNTSQAGKEHIKGFEKLRLSAYDDGFGYLTIGWGHRIGPGDPVIISDATAESLLRQDINIAELAIKRWVKVDLYQHEFDALVGLIFNIGVGKFSTSTLLKRLNQGRYDLASIEIPKWRKSRGRVVAGLVRRREIEKRIFDTGIYNAK